MRPHVGGGGPRSVVTLTSPAQVNLQVKPNERQRRLTAPFLVSHQTF